MLQFGVVSSADTLLKEICDGITKDGGFGSFTSCIYDTAWVSMIHDKHQPSQRMFPECFQYILHVQSEDGSWQGGGSQIDSILCTLASLLALQQSLPLETPAVSKAIAFLTRALNEWRVEECIHVGFEILVPAHLRMLEKVGIGFEFPGKQVLLALNQRKLAKFRPEMLYQQSSTMHHSLEAFVDVIDFNKLSHLKSNGSMMGSPSSTAAYLMNISERDLEAEEYLRAVIAHDKNKNAVPSAYPTTIFEVSWVSPPIVLNWP